MKNLLLLLLLFTYPAFGQDTTTLEKKARYWNSQVGGHTLGTMPAKTFSRTFNALANLAISSTAYTHKNTMAELRAMGATEIAALLDGTNEGVMLHGYYAYGDTPEAVIYYKSGTSAADDQGSVIVINGSLKLEHKFPVCDMAYYGLQAEVNTVSVVDRNTLVINNAIKASSKIKISYPGKYWCRANRGGEGGQYYRYMGDPGGTTWWQVGDGDGQPGGINMLSNRTFEMGDGVALKMRGTFMDAYNFITIWNKENVTIRGGKLIGDFDLDPSLNEHKRLDGTNDGGQWGYGISLQGSKNVLIENVDISKMWADGINLAPDYLHSYTVNTDIVVRNIKSHHNRRQGMSIDGGIRLGFYFCEFSDTKGTQPESGVDLENDTNNELVWIKDVLFLGCKFLNNQVGARTAQRVEDELNIRFDNCLFDGNEEYDYDSYKGNTVSFTHCRFAHKVARPISVLLAGAQNHKFDNCEFSDAIKLMERTDVYGTVKTKNVRFDNSKSLDITFPAATLGYIDLQNSINVRIQNCDFAAKTLRSDKKLFTANGAENIEFIGNTVRELGYVFDVQNLNVFKFNNNEIINTLTLTGGIGGNVKYFELCGNRVSGNSYYTPSAYAPVFLLGGSGNAFGRISENTIYKDPIFTRVGAYTGEGTGLYREGSNISDNVVVAGNKTYGFTNSNAFQFHASSTNLSVSYLNQDASTTFKGVVKQAATISSVGTADATDLATAQTLVNDLKAKINTIIADQKTAGQIEP